jgi:GxxExxY protein
MLGCSWESASFIGGKLDQIAPIHEAQLQAYVRLSGVNLGLLFNFNTVMLKDGIKRCRI